VQRFSSPDAQVPSLFSVKVFYNFKLRNSCACNCVYTFEVEVKPFIFDKKHDFLGRILMLRLSKKVEYGLIAIRHIAMQPVGSVTTAREIAAKYRIPYELLAKVLQSLAKSGLIVAHHGVKGGYLLAKSPGQIPLSLIVRAIEGRQVVAECIAQTDEDCPISDTCTIKSPLHKIQSNLDRILSDMTLSEIV
jgi:Rrf2 family protein